MESSANGRYPDWLREPRLCAIVLLVVLILLLSSTAWAHLPHDVVTALAAPAALDDSAPWTLVASPGGVDLLLRSQDGGRSWFFTGGPPTADNILDATFLEDGWTVLLGESELLGDHRLWWTQDGVDWQSQDLSGFDLLAARGTELVVAGNDGLSTVQLNQAPQLELSEPIQALGSGGSAALAHDGTVWVDRDGWLDLGRPTDDGLSVVADATTAYVGTQDGSVWRHDGTVWQICGALPDTGGLPHVERLALAEGAVIAAPAGRAPLFSFDDCATWEERSGIFTLYDTDGGATGPDQAVAFLQVSGDTVAIGGWAGLSISRDEGQSWIGAAVLPPDATRGLAFSPNFAVDHQLWIGSYTGGVLRSLDGGASLSAPDLGLESVNVQQVSAHPKHGWRLAAVAGHVAWTSVDGGLHWGAVDAPMDYVQAADAYDRGLWVTGRDGDVAWRSWGGTRWWTPPAVANGSRLSQVVLDGAVTKCVSVRDVGALRCLEPDGLDWWDMLKVGEARMTRVEQAADDTLVVGHGDSILHSEDAGQTWEEELQLDLDQPYVLARTPAHDVLAGTRAGRILVRDDDGSWTDVGVQLPAAPEVMAARPDFADYPQILVGTWAGTFVVDLTADPDADPNSWTGTLAPFAAVQWIDDHTDAICEDCLTEPGDGATGGRVAILPDDVPLTVDVRGQRLAVRGRLPAGALLEVDLQDVWGNSLDAQLVRGPTDAVGELVAFPQLDDAWYRLRLVGHGGARLDAVVGERAWQPLDVTPWPAVEPTGCGCTALPSQDRGRLLVGLAGLGLALLTAARRRRDRPGRRTRR